MNGYYSAWLLTMPLILFYVWKTFSAKRFKHIITITLLCTIHTGATLLFATWELEADIKARIKQQQQQKIKSTPAKSTEV